MKDITLNELKELNAAAYEELWKMFVNNAELDGIAIGCLREEQLDVLFNLEYEGYISVTDTRDIVLESKVPASPLIWDDAAGRWMQED